MLRRLGETHEQENVEANTKKLRRLRSRSCPTESSILKRMLAAPIAVKRLRSEPITASSGIPDAQRRAGNRHSTNASNASVSSQSASSTAFGNSTPGGPDSSKGASSSNIQAMRTSSTGFDTLPDLPKAWIADIVHAQCERNFQVWKIQAEELQSFKAAAASTQSVSPVRSRSIPEGEQMQQEPPDRGAEANHNDSEDFSPVGSTPLWQQAGTGGTTNSCSTSSSREPPQSASGTSYLLSSPGQRASNRSMAPERDDSHQSDLSSYCVVGEASKSLRLDHVQTAKSIY